MLSAEVEFSFGTETKILRLSHLRGDRSKIDGESGLYAGNILVREEFEELSCCAKGLLANEITLGRGGPLVDENGFGKSLDARSL